MLTAVRALLIVMFAAPCAAQSLSAKWEELTAADFVQALQTSKATCALPFGIIEKHGPAGPLGTDLINVRYTTTLAAKQEYTIIFPEYYFGQIAEARHQPGTVAYSANVQLQLLQETVQEMGRNGCQKVIIINGHGGNSALRQYFTLVQLDSAKEYVVYTVNGLSGGLGTGANDPTAAQPSRPGVDGHAGESEVSNVMASRPELAHPDRSVRESGADLARLQLPEGVTTSIAWYARFPNHYQGDSGGSNASRGDAVSKAIAQRLAEAIRAIKADDVGPRLQKEFFEKSTRPANTKQ